MMNEQFAEPCGIKSVMLACPVTPFSSPLTLRGDRGGLKKDSRQAGMTIDKVFTYELFGNSLQCDKESLD
jgi:hypothetical protein